MVLTVIVLLWVSTDDKDIGDGVVDRSVDGAADLVLGKGKVADGVVDSKDDGLDLLAPIWMNSGVVWSFAAKLLRGAAKPGGNKPGGKATAGLA